MTSKSKGHQSNHLTSSSSSSSASAIDNNDKALHKCRADFVFISELGEGSFSTVHLAREKSTGREFAVKECIKKLIIRERKVQQIYREKEVMAILSKKENHHPFIVHIYCTFQDKDSLYIVMTLAKGGELLKKLKKYKKFDLNTTRFYASEIVSALSLIHSLNIVHRDLKPENILLSETGHILISDFGSATIIGKTDSSKDSKDKLLAKEGDGDGDGDGDDDGNTRRRRRLCSFVGTAQYVSPEVLNGDVVDESCDYWALGVIIYQLLSGVHAFYDESEYLIYRKILNAQFGIPDGMHPDAVDIIRRLLVVDAKLRLGSAASGGIDSIKQHPFFENIQWDSLAQVQPPHLE